MGFRWGGQKVCSQAGRVLEGGMKTHGVFGPVNGPVDVTQGMQVEDQWEIKLRRGWGPR